MNFIVAAIGDWNKKCFIEYSAQYSGNWYFVDNPDDLNHILETVSPRYVFFPHWRWIVPARLLNTFECICFHMTDLPYGRGGSPLQNLIVRGHKDSVLTALKMNEELDAGPVYMKKPLSLDGRAEEIYKRASLLTWEMIKELIDTRPEPVPQEGEVTSFKRRKPADSELPESLSISQVYDYIRMLDAPGYPKAFIEYGDYLIEFDTASLMDDGGLKATATITLKVSK